MFFGLINTPATIFQSYIIKFLVEKLNFFIIVYFDDIFIYTESKGKQYIKTI